MYLFIFYSLPTFICDLPIFNFVLLTTFAVYSVAVVGIYRSSGFMYKLHFNFVDCVVFHRNFNDDDKERNEKPNKQTNNESNYGPNMDNISIDYTEYFGCLLLSLFLMAFIISFVRDLHLILLLCALLWRSSLVFNLNSSRHAFVGLKSRKHTNM